VVSNTACVCRAKLDIRVRSAASRVRSVRLSSKEYPPLAQRGWWLWCHWGLQWYLHQPAWWPAGISGYSLRSPERGAPKGGAGAAGPGAGGAGCPAAPGKAGTRTGSQDPSRRWDRASVTLVTF